MEQKYTPRLSNKVDKRLTGHYKLPSHFIDEDNNAVRPIEEVPHVMMPGKALAEFLQTSPMTVTRWKQNGLIPSYNEKKYFDLKEVVDALIDFGFEKKE